MSVVNIRPVTDLKSRITMPCEKQKSVFLVYMNVYSKVCVNECIQMLTSIVHSWQVTDSKSQTTVSLRNSVCISPKMCVNWNVYVCIYENVFKYLRIVVYVYQITDFNSRSAMFFEICVCIYDCVYVSIYESLTLLQIPSRESHCIMKKQWFWYTCMYIPDVWINKCM